MTVILMFFTGVFGTAYWLLAIKPAVAQEVGSGPDRPVASDDDTFGSTF